jgi:hypothetical protein
LMIYIELGLVHNTCRSVSRLTMVVVVSEWLKSPRLT